MKRKLLSESTGMKHITLSWLFPLPLFFKAKIGQCHEGIPSGCAAQLT